MPPTSPQDLSTVILDETTVRVTWKPPVQPGADSDNLTYGVYLSVSDSDRVKLFSVTETRSVISSRFILCIYIYTSIFQFKELVANVSTLDLLPGRSYTVSVRSENAITDQVPADQFSTIAVSLTFILPVNSSMERVTTVETASMTFTLPVNSSMERVTTVETASMTFTLPETVDSSLAVIITVPIILLVLLAIVTTTVVIIVLKIRPKAIEVEESYYSEVGLPPLPMRIERNTSNQGKYIAS